MQIPLAILERILSGEVTLAFRRWIRPTVKAGETLRTERGVLRIEAVTQVDAGEIGEREARLAGCASRTELMDQITAGRPGWLYRIELHPEAPDPAKTREERADESAGSQ
jgi:hypothetical protein